GRAARSSWTVGPDGAGGFGGSFAVLTGNDGAPSNGAVISTIERNMSGRISVDQAETAEPKSCPTIIATLRYPSASTSPKVSRTRSIGLHGQRLSSKVTSVPPERPYPR